MIFPVEWLFFFFFMGYIDHDISWSIPSAETNPAGLGGGTPLDLQPARMPGTLRPGAQLFVGDEERQPGAESSGLLQQSHFDGEEVPEGSRRRRRWDLIEWGALQKEARVSLRAASSASLRAAPKASLRVAPYLPQALSLQICGFPALPGMMRGAEEISGQRRESSVTVIGDKNWSHDEVEWPSPPPQPNPKWQCQVMMKYSTKDRMIASHRGSHPTTQIHWNFAAEAAWVAPNWCVWSGPKWCIQVWGVCEFCEVALSDAFEVALSDAGAQKDVGFCWKWVDLGPLLIKPSNRIDRNDFLGQHASICPSVYPICGDGAEHQVLRTWSRTWRNPWK